MFQETGVHHEHFARDPPDPVDRHDERGAAWRTQARLLYLATPRHIIQGKLSYSKLFFLIIALFAPWAAIIWLINWLAL
jgi:hypothetical protein